MSPLVTFFLAQLQFSNNKRQGIKNNETQKKKAKKKKVKKKVKQLTTTLLENKEIRNTIIETADIHSELVNMVINILYKELYNFQ